MTPDKVEAALGVLKGIKVRWNSLGECEEYQKSLSVLTEALAERERDAARLDWLEHNCVNVADDLGTGSQLYLGTYATAPLRQAIDAAMKETP